MLSRMLIITVLVAAMACALDTSGKDACAADDDCVAERSCVLGRCLDDPVWGCLSAKRELSAVDDTRRVTAFLADEISEAPVVGARVRLCVRSDVACATPVSNAESGADGGVDLEIADQYLEIEAEGYVRTLVMSADSLELLDDGVSFGLDLWPSTAFAELIAQGGISVAPDRGIVEVSTRDCGLQSAADVSISIDPTDAQTLVRYPINDVISATTIATDLETATALVLDAQPGAHSVTGHVIARGEQLGRPRSVLVRAGWLSQLALAPDGLGIDDLRAP